ncbi:unnamed protein product [Ranitomeya imitator]|uniref:Uncharacterized protein n=1 Tax=Ranitomeya imitator TaxID=111125 RepID=A0ABN9LMT9_9NEOB|nr:unnamed protein product [Ranitomeya imitator]
MREGPFVTSRSCDRDVTAGPVRTATLTGRPRAALRDATRSSAVKRFSISFARHPTNGFELYSMVPSICPLETLHNSLSLKQVDEFLAAIAAPSSECFLDTPTSSPCGSGPSSTIPTACDLPSEGLRRQEEKTQPEQNVCEQGKPNLHS